ncbi:phage terminase large subunit [Rhodospirillaceae bacterium KN72]|uniref:Phage terminase large subunit n=1 Tax=Pacificispira spongiicola TaxID=2729598 RepID=A0A7Y0HG28_9PROT|nr:phage terminase large subunit [Pacificispira spongiicola]NMM45218.1 phage terminase large subunit [Pacificispira spongiicola]
MGTACTFPEFVWIWTRMQGMDLPDLHRQIGTWLDMRWRAGDRKLVLLAFRAAGKSTLVGLFCAWLLYRDPSLRILVLAAEQDLAARMVRNVKRIIERHPLTEGLKPDRLDQWAADRFTVNRPAELRDPSMLARGIAANVTGSRADVIVCDDVEVPNTCDTAPKRADLRARLGEADYILVPGGMQLYVGTPHSYYSIYADTPRKEVGEDRPFLDGFNRMEVPILTETGKSAWEGRYSLEDIAQLRRRHGEAKFQSQMMLRPVNIAGCRLDPDRMKLYDARLELQERNGEAVLLLDGVRMLSASAWWDPAYGAASGGGTTGGDGSVVACVFTGEDGLYRLHRVQYLISDPNGDVDEARQQCRAVARFARRNLLPSVTVETNGIGKFLPSLLRREMAAMKTGCAVQERHSSKPKDIRILEAFDAALAAGQIACHRSVWGTPFPMEMREWRPGGLSKGHDDGLDAVAGCLSMEPVRLPRITDHYNRQSWHGGRTHTVAATDFDV